MPISTNTHSSFHGFLLADDCLRIPAVALVTPTTATCFLRYARRTTEQVSSDALVMPVRASWPARPFRRPPGLGLALGRLSPARATATGEKAYPEAPRQGEPSHPSLPRLRKAQVGQQDLSVRYSGWHAGRAKTIIETPWKSRAYRSGRAANPISWRRFFALRRREPGLENAKFQGV